MSLENAGNVPRNQEMSQEIKKCPKKKVKMSQEKPFELSDEDLKISLNGTLSTQKEI